MREREKMMQKISAIVKKGLLDGVSFTFVWGSYHRKYTVSNFHFGSFGIYDVYFKQLTNDGMDDHDIYGIDDINDWYMEALLNAIVEHVSIDRNLF